jgi:hypothetical protein
MPYRRPTFVSLCLVLFAAIVWSNPSSLQAAVVYSAVDDFSITSNPNGVWSYREGVNSATLLNNPYTDSSVNTWRGSNFSSLYGNFPYVSKNVSGTTIGANWTTDLLLMHPSETLTPSVVRWTAPTSGSWNVLGAFKNVTSATSDVTIYKNTTSILSGAINGSSNPTVSFNQDVVLTAGDFLEFAVGAQGNWGGDSVGLGATLTLNSPPAVVPEPSGMVIAMGLGLGLVVRRWKRGPTTGLGTSP